MAKKTVWQKAKILSLLRARDKVSGELMASQLGVSRTLVWKHIKSLQSLGYVIAATSNGGYQLLKQPDAVNDFAVLSYLPEDYRGAVFYYQTIGSTNDIAKDLAGTSLPHGSLIIAEVQLKGRGRLGHSWASPSGGVWFTLVLKPSFPASIAPRFALWAAVVIAKILREQTGLPLTIKWPNDLLVGGRKIGGILVEMAAEIGRINYLIIGIGLNTNFKSEQLPAELQAKTTTIYDCLGKKINRAKLIADLAVKLAADYKQVAFDFQQILSEWRRLSATLGQKIKVKAAAEVFSGQAVDIDENGALIVKLDDGQTKLFQAGEVTLVSKEF